MEKRKILLVDDEPEVLETIDNFLEEDDLSYEIMKVPNGMVALKLIEKNRPELIITDWDMPGMDGVELIKALKTNKDMADIPIIMCTGKMISSENLYTSLKAGAVDYIRKPIDKLELIARTRANLHLADNYTRIKNMVVTKDKMFSLIAHDLLGPIGALLGLSNHALECGDKLEIDDQKKYIKLINDGATKAYTLVNNLLTWARTQTDRISFSPKIHPVNDIIKDVLKLFEVRTGVKEISLIAEMDDDLIVLADKDMLQTVLRNLISNAVKFTHRGGQVRVEAHRTIEDNKEFVEISVKDNGLGLEPEIKNNLFKIDKNVSTPGTEKESGTGLGLILCKEFVEKHKGKIWVESEAGKGSAFYFTLPV